MLGGGAGDGKLGVVGVRHCIVEIVLVVAEYEFAYQGMQLLTG